MGHYGGKPREGDRPGQKYKKKSKEIRHGRKRGKSAQLRHIDGQKDRLNSLENRISGTFDPWILEPLFEQYANLAAGCSDEVFVPSEMERIIGYSDLNNQEQLATAANNPTAGSRRISLPIHHMIKILGKKVPLDPKRPYDPNDRHIFLLGSSSYGETEEVDTRNLRALEWLMVEYAGRIPPGKSFSLEIDKKRVVLPYNPSTEIRNQNLYVSYIRGVLQRTGIVQASHYELRRVKSGDHKVIATMHVATVQRLLYREGQPEPVLISYLDLKRPQANKR